jgi:O-antigen/teichoic acid export membrane protein
MKFMLMVIFPLVFLLVAAAPGIIELLYGAGYDRSVPVLRIGAWSMVFPAGNNVPRVATPQRSSPVK